MKLAYIVIPVALLLVGAGCSEKAQPAAAGQNMVLKQFSEPQVQQVQQAPSQPQQESIELVTSDQSDASASLLNFDGSVAKKIVLPKDLIKRIANNIKVYGSKVYYLSGSEMITSVGEIDAVTGESKVLNFTQSKNTNKGNVLSAIIDWSVSADNSVIAWLDTQGNISVANTDGSNKKVYTTKIGNVINNQIQVVGEYVYFVDKNKSQVESVRISDGTITVLATDVSLNPVFAVSSQGRYLAYTAGSDKIQLGVVDLLNNIHSVIPEVGEPTGTIAFTPDETKVLSSPNVNLGDTTTEVYEYDLTKNKIIATLKDTELVDVISNSQILASTVITKGSDFQSKGPYVMNLDGTSKIMVNGGYYRGFLSAQW